MSELIPVCKKQKKSKLANIKAFFHASELFPYNISACTDSIRFDKSGGSLIVNVKEWDDYCNLNNGTIAGAIDAFDKTRINSTKEINKGENLIKAILDTSRMQYLIGRDKKSQLTILNLHLDADDNKCLAFTSLGIIQLPQDSKYNLDVIGDVFYSLRKHIIELMTNTNGVLVLSLSMFLHIDSGCNIEIVFDEFISFLQWCSIPCNGVRSVLKSIIIFDNEDNINSLDKYLDKDSHYFLYDVLKVRNQIEEIEIKIDKIGNKKNDDAINKNEKIEIKNDDKLFISYISKQLTIAKDLIDTVKDSDIPTDFPTDISIYDDLTLMKILLIKLIYIFESNESNNNKEICDCIRNVTNCIFNHFNYLETGNKRSGSILYAIEGSRVAVLTGLIKPGCGFDSCDNIGGSSSIYRYNISTLVRISNKSLHKDSTICQQSDVYIGLLSVANLIIGLESFILKKTPLINIELSNVNSLNLSSSNLINKNQHIIPVISSKKPLYSMSNLPSNFRSGDWFCPLCLDHKFAFKESCNRCNSLKPISNNNNNNQPRVKNNSQAFRPGDWNCPGCGDHKFSFKNICECGYKKPFETFQILDNQTETRPGDWTCPGCGDLKFANRNVCNRCGCKRPHNIDTNPIGVDMKYSKIEGGRFIIGITGDWICPNKSCINNR